MAKEIAIGKRAKISKAQQNMLVMVGVAALVFGIALSLTIHFIQQIMFNSRVIAAEEKSITEYSRVIESIGICKKPSGEIYSAEELKACDPDSIDVSMIPGTLRANILEKLAANKALYSVPKETLASCIDPSTGKNFTQEKLEDIYDEAEGADELNKASQLIKRCSALRVIPDALPAFRNEEALLASLNKLFLESGWQPESLSPGGSSSDLNAIEVLPGLNALSVNLSVEADANVTKDVLDNIERSIREFDISKASIKWGSDNTLSLSAQAIAYYMDRAAFAESSITINAEGN